MEIRTVEMIEPASSGIKCEKLCSRKVQSAIMVLVRSAKSFLPEKGQGDFAQMLCQRNAAHAAFFV
jgi:hypothetical protein